MTRTFTLNKANGKLMGVCAGLADSTGFDVTVVRLLLVAVTLCLTGMTIPLYIAAGLIAPARG
jgi:phage shock protein C